MPNREFRPEPGVFGRTRRDSNYPTSKSEHNIKPSNIKGAKAPKSAQKDPVDNGVSYWKPESLYKKDRI